METMLKGDSFTNRYRITGILKTLSPLHIGTGDQAPSNVENPDEHTVATIFRDHLGRPLIPGSSLRGVMRHWLLDVLNGLGARWVDTRDYTVSLLTNLSQTEQIQQVRQDFSRLELLFGTPFNAGKLEVWDAECVTTHVATSSGLQNWNSAKLTYTQTSVAIDPATGTALENLLYTTEVVPPGVEFELNVVGQNLSEQELGLILFALQGFNSEIYPIQLGSRAANGRGRMQFNLAKVCCLERDKLQAWVKASLEAISVPADTAHDQSAGYFALKELDVQECQALIDSVRMTLLAELS